MWREIRPVDQEDKYELDSAPRSEGEQDEDVKFRE